ncbi:hypothetical protein [Leucobacter denitrificans]|uniref:Uncharacterized protein n=1 Tax=Leucobacter denitrificans TaxID=683042 RepID=A0A7G9S4P0_9MICO|nr:hypothetical protein [Leucobacter denitrificans]QNN62815.1 hypothetical protein H9L06_11515 [Leucobacter denitrificans]
MRAGRIIAWVVGVLLVGLYGYATVAAIGNLMGMSTYLGAVLGPFPWVLLGVAIAIPAIALGVALLLARGRGAGVRLLMIAAGLCVTAAIHLEIMHLIS